MSRPEDDEEDLDDILDSALDEFDVGPIAGSPARDPSKSRGESGSASSGPEALATDQRGRDAPAGTNADGGREKNDEGVRAFEDALRKLEQLQSAPGGGAGVKDSEEEEDLRLVEEFLRSLSTQFENMSLPPDSRDASRDGPTDDLSRELAALFSGSESTGGGAKIPGAEQAVNSAISTTDIATAGSSVTDAAVHGEPLASAAAGAAASSSAVGPEFEKIVESVVGELLSKDVLKGPMEEMRLAYEHWLPTNEASLDASECGRFRKQQAIVGKICALYESGTDNPSSVMTLLQEMQDTGAPPSEVIRQLGDNDEAASDATLPGGPLGDLEKLAKCPVQ